jgi:hypothetical protein
MENVPALVTFGIPVLSFLVAALFVAGAARSGAPPKRARLAALGAAGLFVVPGVAALSGILADTTRRPPPMALVLAACVVTTVFAARSSLGARIANGLPLWALVGVQSFRLPLELVMHRAARAGVMPVEMSFEGYNFDIVTGVTALVLAVALYVGHVPRAVVVAWNVLGSVLLAVIVTVAVAAMPFVHAFGPEHVNRWVLYFPYVWLASVLVQAALFGHIVIFRRLASERGVYAPARALPSES